MATLLEQAREVKQDRARLIEQNKTLNDKAWNDSKRAFTAEEQGEFDKRFEDIAKLTTRAENLEKLDAEERKLVADKPEPRGGKPEKEGRGDSPAKEYRTTVAARAGVPEITRTYELDDTQEARRKIFRAYLRDGRSAAAQEARALEATSDPAGGYTIAPMQFVADLIKFVDNAVFFRGLATVTQVTNADSIGRPSLDNDPADADWTVELGTGDEDSTMSFGMRELEPHPLAKRIKVSKTLIRRSALAMESLVISRLGYKFAVTEEKAFLTGSGANQPLGVFTASANGISTGRDVSTDNTTSAFTGDGLINAKFTLKGAYWPGARWIFHRDAVKMLTKLKDGEGRYLWSGSLVGGQPDQLLNVPVLISEYAPNTFTTGLYVGIIGDFSNYWIADSLAMTVERLTELYAETNQMGYIGRLETDGMPTLEEAFVRVKLG